MNSHSVKNIGLLPTLTISALLFLTTAYTSNSHAASIQNPTPSATKNMELAYFQVYRNYPRYYYYGPSYYRPGYYYRPGPIYWRGRGPYYGVRCQKNCYVNRYGAVVRCVRSCY
ncbi:Uncharacterised protein [Legionella donaldsonii]|uniref:Uncharacterized protein n=1 Tax=Legionella donaldsonii TaxID=45060 RepID=A0A378J303_9GAMM|nr:hypothetical protein [Legionella donaldsonii]STX42122.1 Uncharacterised protein [Legionella donaldsonii]